MDRTTFTLSLNIAIEVTNVWNATAAYVQLPGIEARPIDDRFIESKHSGRFLALDRHEAFRIVMELFVSYSSGLYFYLWQI